MQAQDKLEQVYAAYAEVGADFDILAEEQARLEAIIATSGSDLASATTWPSCRTRPGAAT
jgi:sulfate-transporting ATPase